MAGQERRLEEVDEDEDDDEERLGRVVGGRGAAERSDWREIKTEGPRGAHF